MQLLYFLNKDCSTVMSSNSYCGCEAEHGVTSPLMKAEYMHMHMHDAVLQTLHNAKVGQCGNIGMHVCPTRRQWQWQGAGAGSKVLAHFNLYLSVFPIFDEFGGVGCTYVTFLFQQKHGKEAQVFYDIDSMARGANRVFPIDESGYANGLNVSSSSSTSTSKSQSMSLEIGESSF